MPLHDKYSIFYHCEESGDDVPSNSPVEYQLDTIIDMSMQLLLSDGDFFGVVNGEGRTVQFIVDGNSIVIDIPDLIKQGSHSREIRMSELENTIKCIDQLFLDNLKGYKFSSW